MIADKKTVLLVHPPGKTGDLLEHQLVMAGYAVVGFTTGAACLAWLEGDRADLAFLAVGLPDQSGFEVCRKLRARAGTEFLPVILLAEKEGLASEAHEAQAHGDLYLAKASLSAQRLLAMAGLFLADSHLVRRSEAPWTPRP